MPAYFSSADFVGSLAGAVRDVFTHPTEYFRQMPVATSYKDSAILLVIVLAVPLGLSVLLNGSLAMHFAPFLALLVIPFSLASAWLWAWYLSWAVRRFSGGNLSIIDAFQLYAYSSIPGLFSWVPMLNFIMGIWSVYLEWKGLTTFAGVSNGKAMMIIFLPIIILIISGAVLAVLVGIFLSQHSQSGVEQMF